MAKKGQFSLREEFGDSHGATVLPATCKSAEIAIGEAFVLESERIKPSNRDFALSYGFSEEEVDLMSGDVPDREKEIFKAEQKQKFEDAMQRSVATFEGNIEKAKKFKCVELEDVMVSSLTAELGMIRDPDLIKNVNKMIDEGATVEVAIDTYYEDKIQKFGSMSMPQIQKMVAEMKQHRSIYQHHLAKKPLATAENIPPGSIVVAKDLPLSSLMHFIDENGELKVEGVITGSGSMESHAAFIVQGLGVAYARSDVDRINPGELTIINGMDSEVLLHPNQKVVERCREERDAQDAMQEALRVKWADNRKAYTRTRGEKVNVHVNFGASFEAHAVKKANPAGIGLYRTEVVDIMRGPNPSPTAEQWKNIWMTNMRDCSRADSVSGYIGTTIRFIDLAGDKSDIEDRVEREEKQDRITKTQMRAMALMQKELNDIEDGLGTRKFKAMVPMIRSAEHMAEMQELMDEIAADEGVPPVQLGCMYEVPALAADLHYLNTAFISVGSNDLIHSILDIDRYTGDSINKYDPTHGAVLHELRRVTKVGKDRDIPVSICGDMASESKYTALLIGLGFRNLSADAASVPIVQEISSRVDVAEAERLVELIAGTPKRADRERIIEEFNQTHLGLDPNGQVDLNWWSEPPEPDPEWAPQAA